MEDWANKEKYKTELICIAEDYCLVSSDICCKSNCRHFL